MTKRKNRILDVLSDIQKPNEHLEKTLFRLLKDEEFLHLFLTTVIQNPRDNKQAYRFITESFKSKQKKRKWLYCYRQVYTNYINRYFTTAKCIEDILKIMPNLTPWTLEQRFGKIKMGIVPDIFGNEADFLTLIKKINTSSAVKTFKHIKKLECSLPDFQEAFPAVKKIDWFNFSEKSDFLRDLLQKKCGKPFQIKQNGKTYQITFLCNPFSSKMVFEIKINRKGTYILKESPYQFLNTKNDRVRKEHENMAIRADSTYSNAILEFYLKLNNCPHVSDILYYNFNHEVVLYQAEKGNFITDTLPDFHNFHKKFVPDLARLGIYINDINNGNFMISKKDGQIKVIDTGHASFINPLTPGVPGLTFTLGNLCGQDYISEAGVLDLEDV